MTMYRVFRLPYDHKESKEIVRMKKRRAEANAKNKAEVERIYRESGRRLPISRYIYEKYKMKLHCVTCFRNVSFKVWFYWNEAVTDLQCYVCATRKTLVKDNPLAIQYNEKHKASLVWNMKRKIHRTLGQRQLYAMNPNWVAGFKCVRCFDTVPPERVIMYKQVNRIYCEPCQNKKTAYRTGAKSKNWQKAGGALLPKREQQQPQQEKTGNSLPE